MNWKSLIAAATVCTLAITPSAFAAEAPASDAADVTVERVVANCSSEPYGKAINSFTYYVDSTADIMDLTAEDFL